MIRLQYDRSEKLEWQKPGLQSVDMGKTANGPAPSNGDIPQIDPNLGS